MQAISRLAYCNPFLPEQIACEREALGSNFSEADAVWNISPDLDAVSGGHDWPIQAEPANWTKIVECIEALVPTLREQLVRGAQPRESDLALYRDTVHHLLWRRYVNRIRDLRTGAAGQASGHEPMSFYKNFLQDWNHFFSIPNLRITLYEPQHIFAILFQLRRAFHFIFSYIIGASDSVVRLRAAVWQSIFTHDMRRYLRILHERMGDLTTLIVGPSGTGKELVARAIAYSRYIPFDPETRTFAGDYAESFHALNLSALTPTLIESELFGHCKGAFTGAVKDRAGWFEVCPPLGTVFLDEIGDVSEAIQVKLLRVLETRTFQRIGDTQERTFPGKVMAATNRDLAREIQRGRFRIDFYYRLCSDIVTTPTLHEQVRDAPDELRSLVLGIATRLLGKDAEVLTDETTTFIREHLGADYMWPGNMRELQQCVRNVMVRGTYRPLDIATPSGNERLSQDVTRGRLTVDELLQRYCSLVYAQTGSFTETARRLGIDPRTVKSKVSSDLVEEFRAQGPRDGAV